MQIDLWRSHGSTTLDKPHHLSKPQFPHLLNGVNSDACVIVLLCGFNETMHIKHSELCLQRQMFGECRYDGYCGWPGSLATMMFYSTSLSNIYTLWLMNISTTSTLWSIYEIASWICLEMCSLWSLGWSQLNITQVSLLASLLLQGWWPQGSLLPVYWRPPALPCPAVPLLRGSSQGCLGYSPACWPSQFPCLSEFRNVDQSLLILVLSFLQDYVEKSHPPIFSEASPHLPFSLECVRVHAQLCLTLCDSMGYNLPGFPGNNTGASCQFLLQGIFPTQGSNPCLLHWQVDSLLVSHLGSPVWKCLPKYL